MDLKALISAALFEYIYIDLELFDSLAKREKQNTKTK